MAGLDTEGCADEGDGDGSEGEAEAIGHFASGFMEFRAVAFLWIRLVEFVNFPFVFDQPAEVGSMSSYVHFN